MALVQQVVRAAEEPIPVAEITRRVHRLRPIEALAPERAIWHSSIAPQGCERINLRRPSRRNPTRQQRDANQHQRDACNSHGICRLYAEQQIGQQTCQRERCQQADADPEANQGHPLYWFPGLSSSGRKARPIAAVTPLVVKYPALTRRPSTRSGSPCPVRLKLVFAETATLSKTASLAGNQQNWPPNCPWSNWSWGMNDRS